MTVQSVKLNISSTAASMAKNSASAIPGTFNKCINNTFKNITGNSSSADNTGASISDSKKNMTKAGYIKEKLDNTANDTSSKDVNILNVNVVDDKLCVTVVENGSANEIGIDLDELADAIKDFICKKLGITEEEYNKALDDSGVNAVNLLQIQSLQQFFVSLNGIDDFSELLTNADLGEAWQNLMSGLDDFAFDSGGVSLNAEQLADIFQKASSASSVNNGNQVDSEDRSGTNTNDTLTGNTKIPEVTLNVENSNNEQNSASSDALSQHNERGPVNVEELGDNSLFAQFMDRLESAVSEPAAADVSQQVRQMREIFNQVVDGIKLNVKPNTSSIELQLNPAELGKVNIAIEMKNGVATASFIVRNEMARVALENQMQTLKETFENQGLKVESVEVSVSDFAFEQNTQAGYEEDKNSSDNNNFVTDDEITEKFMSDKEVEQSPNLNDGEVRINITA